MNVVTLLRLVNKNLRWLVLIPLSTAIIAWFFTRDMEKTYKTQMVVYTGLASGYDITASARPSIDYFGVSNAFDNLITTAKARETLTEVALRLLAQHISLKNPVPMIADQKTLTEMVEIIPAELRNKVVVKGNPDSTYFKLRYLLDDKDEQILQYVLYESKSPYAVNVISSNLTVNRQQNSDMLEMVYTAHDPGVALNTLKFLSMVFIENYKNIKGYEAENVIKYFEEQLKIAEQNLRDAETRLKSFGIENRIINYNEQTRYIAEFQEKLKDEKYKEKMVFESSKASVKSIESRLDDGVLVIANNQEFTRKRAELVKINEQIATSKLYGYNTDDLEKQADKVEAELRLVARASYKLSNTLEFLPPRELLEEWLNKTIILEESAARLGVYDRRMEEFDKLYDDFAPLGSTLKILERNAELAENQYLSILEGLNTARLKQQNVEKSNTLKVIDQPFFPFRPLPSSRKFIIIGGFIGMLLITLGLIIASELLNNSIKNPENAIKLTGLPLLSSYPDLIKVDPRIDYQYIKKGMLEQVVSGLNINFYRDYRDDGPRVTLFTSIRSGEGKTYIAAQIANKMAALGKKVLLLTPNISDVELEDNEAAIQTYVVDSHFAGLGDLKQLTKNPDFDVEDWDYIMVELPDLLHHPIPVELISGTDLTIFVVDARNTWSLADDHIKKLYQEACRGKIMMMLNRVSADNLEGVLGDIPKRRSKIRTWVKKQINFLPKLMNM